MRRRRATAPRASGWLPPGYRLSLVEAPGGQLLLVTEVPDTCEGISINVDAAGGFERAHLRLAAWAWSCELRAAARRAIAAGARPWRER